MTWIPPNRTDHNYIRTLSGRKFWPLNPRPEDVDINDIASALSLMCRYNGHLPYLYSVGQHSLNVFYHSGLRWGLLHDATEAYLPDVPRPIKSGLPFFKEIEQRLHDVIAEHFGLDSDSVHCTKRADNEVLQWEYKHFRPSLTLSDQQQTVRDKPVYVNFEQTRPDIVKSRFIYEYRRAVCGSV